MTFGFVYWNEAAQLGGNVVGFVAGVMLIVFGLGLLLMKKRSGSGEAEKSGPLANVLAAAFGSVGLLDVHGKAGLLRRVHSDSNLARTARAGAALAVTTTYDTIPLLRKDSLPTSTVHHAVLPSAPESTFGQSTSEAAGVAVASGGATRCTVVPRAYGRCMSTVGNAGRLRVLTVTLGNTAAGGAILCVKEGSTVHAQSVGAEEGVEKKGPGSNEALPGAQLAQPAGEQVPADAPVSKATIAPTRLPILYRLGIGRVLGSKTAREGAVTGSGQAPAAEAVPAPPPALRRNHPPPLTMELHVVRYRGPWSDLARDVRVRRLMWALHAGGLRVGRMDPLGEKAQVKLAAMRQHAQPYRGMSVNPLRPVPVPHAPSHHPAQVAVLPHLPHWGGGHEVQEEHGQAQGNVVPTVHWFSTRMLPTGISNRGRSLTFQAPVSVPALPQAGLQTTRSLDLMHGTGRERRGLDEGPRLDELHTPALSPSSALSPTSPPRSIEPPLIVGSSSPVQQQRRGSEQWLLQNIPMAEPERHGSRQIVVQPHDSTPGAAADDGQAASPMAERQRDIDHSHAGQVPMPHDNMVLGVGVLPSGFSLPVQIDPRAVPPHIRGLVHPSLLIAVIYASRVTVTGMERDRKQKGNIHKTQQAIIPAAAGSAL